MSSTPFSYLCFRVEVHAFHMREEMLSNCGAVILSRIVMRWGCFDWWAKIDSWWMINCQDVGRHVLNVRDHAHVRLEPVTAELHCQASGMSAEVKRNNNAELLFYAMLPHLDIICYRDIFCCAVL